MFKLGALVVTGISASYMGFEAKRFRDFKAFKQSGYDENFRIFEGILTKTVEPTSQCNLLIKNGNIIEDSDNRAIRKVIVEEGKKKVGTYYTTMQVGKQCIMIPHTYTYTDFQMITSQISHASEFKVDTVPVNLPIKTVENISLNFSEVKLYPAQTQFAFDLLKYNRNSLHPNAIKYKFREGHISYGDKITVAGEYTNKKFLVASYLGDKQTVLELIRKQKYSVSIPGIFIAGSAIIASIYVICFDDFDA